MSSNSANFGSNNIVTSGSLGVNTYSPSYQLDVAGTGNINLLKINDQYSFPTGVGSVGDSLVYSGSNQIAWSGITGGGTHPTIAAASSSDNADRVYIQDILLDSYGHVTGIATATETVTDTTYSDGSGILLDDNNVFHANVASTTQTTTPNSLSSTSNRTYSIQIDSNDKLVVNVPWTDTDTTVPLSGQMTGDIDMNNYSITGVAGADGINIDGDITANYFFGDLNGPIVVECKNSTGSTIAAGTPVYVSGYYSNNGKALISVAKANDSSKMPAIGLLETALSNDAEGHVHCFGLANHLDSSAFSVGQTVYVHATGGLTNTRPTGVNELVQNIGRVLRSDSSQGRILVLGPGRTNDVPNSGHFEQLTVDEASNFLSTIYAPNIGAGEDNSVVVLDSDGKLRIDEIDSRVWGSSLVDGNGTANYTAKWSDSDTLTSGIIYDNGTNVGIGTNNPSECPLHIEKSGDACILIRDTSDASYAGLLIRDSGNQQAGSFQYGGHDAALIANEVAAGSRQSGVPFVLYQGDYNSNGGFRPEDRRMSFNTDGNVYFYSGVNVGIGTALPSVKLDVSGAINSTLASNNKLVVKTNSVVGKLQAYDTTSSVYAGAESNSHFVLRSNNTDRLTLYNTNEGVWNEGGLNYDFRVEGSGDANLLFTDASTDRVGIGTATPSYQLHVTETAYIQSGIISPTIAFRTYDIPISGPPTYDGFIAYTNSDCWGSGNNNNDGFVFEKTDGNQSNPDGGIFFNVRGSGGISSTAMSINGSKEIFIGQTGTYIPQGYSLNVKGGATLDSLNINNAFAFPTGDGTNSQVLATDGNGNVSWSGISDILSGFSDYEVLTTSKSTFTVNGGYTVGSLDVYYNGLKLIDGDDYTATNGTTFTLATAAGSADVIEWEGHRTAPEYATIGNPGNYRLMISDGSSTTINGQSDLVYSSTGLGVGTSSPSYKLHVAGSGRINALNINGQFTLPTGDGSLNQVLTTDGAGNVTWSTQQQSTTITSSYIYGLIFR